MCQTIYLIYVNVVTVLFAKNIYQNKVFQYLSPIAFPHSCILSLCLTFTQSKNQRHSFFTKGS